MQDIDIIMKIGSQVASMAQLVLHFPVQLAVSTILEIVPILSSLELIEIAVKIKVSSVKLVGSLLFQQFLLQNSIIILDGVIKMICADRRNSICIANFGFLASFGN